MNPSPEPNLSLSPEETLDPQDWSAMRSLGHRMVDEMMSYLETVRERPVWQPIPERVKAAQRAPLPLEAEGAAAVYEDFRSDVLQHPLGNIHPRFWGWVIGTGTPLGALADMLASTMNPNMGGGDTVPNLVELQVLDWLKQMLGYPSEASGLLVTGGSMANLVGLTVARNAKAETDVAERGLAVAPRPMVLYGSSETHNSVRKAVSLLGLGRESLRAVAVDGEFRIDLDALRRAIASDRAAGLHPFCVVGNAGTVNTGAFDDLASLAEICAREQLWFHVDGAFGALAAISPKLRPLVAGMERADSLAFDLHKWMYMPYDVGCALVRWRDHHRAAFTLPADYLTQATRGVAGGPVWFSEYGIQLSRSFRALKVWMSLKEHGVKKYARLIEQNCDQAQFLAARVDANPALERMAPVPLNIVCFRFVSPGLGGEQCDQLNQEILFQLHESGVAVPSSTKIGGRLAIRTCICNHRTRREDLELLVREVIERGQKQVAATVR